MRIIPEYPISINNVHAPYGVVVDVADEKLARELIAIRAARLAPPEPVIRPAIQAAPVAPPVETAAVDPVVETAARQPARPRKVGR